MQPSNNPAEHPLLTAVRDIMAKQGGTGTDDERECLGAAQAAVAHLDREKNEILQQLAVLREELQAFVPKA